jgi:hypothetical protein
MNKIKNKIKPRRPHPGVSTVSNQCLFKGVYVSVPQTVSLIRHCAQKNEGKQKTNGRKMTNKEITILPDGVVSEQKGFIKVTG